MKIKNGELESYIRVFQKLYRIEFTDPAKSYKIFKFFTKLEQEYVLLIKHRMKLESEYFELDKNGMVVIGENNQPKLLEGKSMDKYLEKLRAVLNEDSDIDIPDIQFTEKEIMSSNIPLAPADYYIIDKFIKEEN